MSSKTLGERSHLTVVNADPANITTGTAVMSLIVAEATRRQRTIHITSIQYDTERGIGVLVADAGSRQHLANALGFEPDLYDFRVANLGTGTRRCGLMAGMPVAIWNLEP